MRTAPRPRRIRREQALDVDTHGQAISRLEAPARTSMPTRVCATSTYSSAATTRPTAMITSR